MHYRSAIATLSLAWVLGGCATANIGDKAVEAELKKFASRPGKVSLYVCRVDTINGGGVGTEVFVNDRTLGSLKPNTFTHTELEPGDVSVFLRRNGFGLHSGDSGTLKLKTREGEVVLVWAGPAGFMGPLTVDSFSTTAEGQSCITKASYAVR